MHTWHLSQVKISPVICLIFVNISPGIHLIFSIFHLYEVHPDKPDPPVLLRHHVTKLFAKRSFFHQTICQRTNTYFFRQSPSSVEFAVMPVATFFGIFAARPPAQVLYNIISTQVSIGWSYLPGLSANGQISAVNLNVNCFVWRKSFSTVLLWHLRH